MIPRSIKPLSTIVGVATMSMSPAIVLARHHPGDRGMEPPSGAASLWIFLGIIAFVVIMALVTRKKK